MTDNQLPTLFDKRLVKGMIKGILHDHVKASMKYLLAFSPKALTDELEIGDPVIKLIWVLAGSLEIEDRAFKVSYVPTAETQTRESEDDEPDPFKYQSVSDVSRLERREPLISRESVIVCFACAGKKELVEDCADCKGTGKIVCEVCKGKLYREVLCKNCMGTGIEPGFLHNACKVCKGRNANRPGFVREPCPVCKETGFSQTPCPKCEKGKIRFICQKCQGTGFLLRKTYLWIRERTLPLRPESLHSGEKLLSSMLDTMEDIYLTPPLPLRDLKTYSNPLPPQIWERVTTRLAQRCTAVLQEDNKRDYESQVKSVRASISITGRAHAQFRYRDRFGDIWVALGNKGQPVEHSIAFFPIRFSDFATELLTLLLTFFVGAAFSWYFASWFPFLTIGLAGVFLILAFRYLEWRAELASLLVKGFFFLIIFLGIIGILTVFIQSISKGQMDTQTILALIALAVMTTFAIVGIQSEQAATFFAEFIKTIFKK